MPRRPRGVPRQRARVPRLRARDYTCEVPVESAAVIAPDTALPLVIGLPLLGGTVLAAVAGRRSATAAAWALAAVVRGRARPRARRTATRPGRRRAGGVLALGARARAECLAPARRARRAVRDPHPRDRPARHPVCPLLPGRERSARPVLRPARVLHGRDARRRARRQPAPPRGVLGADERRLVPADRLLAHARRRAPGRTHGARGHRDRRAGDARRLPPDREHRGHLRDLRTRRHARPDRGRSAVSGRPRARPSRRVHQERAVPVPFLAARGDGGADAGVGVPALGDDGEGGRVPARPPLPGARRDTALRLHRRHRRAGDVRVRAPTSRCSSTISRGCSPTRRSATSG